MENILHKEAAMGESTWVQKLKEFETKSQKRRKDIEKAEVEKKKEAERNADAGTKMQMNYQNKLQAWKSSFSPVNQTTKPGMTVPTAAIKPAPVINSPAPSSSMQSGIQLKKASSFLSDRGYEHIIAMLDGNRRLTKLANIIKDLEYGTRH